MNRRFATRLARLENAAGLDPSRALQLQRDADAELNARIELAESRFLAELAADCMLQWLGLAPPGARLPGSAVAPSAGLELLRKLRAITCEDGATWALRVRRLLDRVDTFNLLGRGSEGYGRARELLVRCAAELRIASAALNEERRNG